MSTQCQTYQSPRWIMKWQFFFDSSGVIHVWHGAWWAFSILLIGVKLFDSSSTRPITSAKTARIMSTGRCWTWFGCRTFSLLMKKVSGFRSINAVNRQGQCWCRIIDSKRHVIMTRNMLLEIHPDGEIMLSGMGFNSKCIYTTTSGRVYWISLKERLSLKIGCHMDLKFYPFDLQVCPIHVESYAYREDQLNIEWHTNYSIEISADLTLPTFSLVSNLIRH